MNRSQWMSVLILGALCLATAQDSQQAPARDLSGLWSLEGKLPNGETASGYVALTPLKTAGRYRALVADGSGSTWRASLWTVDGTAVQLRPYRSAAGVAGALAGATDPWLAKLSANGTGFMGGYDDGPAGLALSLTPAELPTLTVDGKPVDSSASLRIQVGPQTLAVGCEPAAARKLVRFYGASALRPSWADTGLAIQGQAGSFQLEARLGGSKGPVLSSLSLTSTSDALARVRARIAEVKAAGKTPIVIFDLDDTVFDTRYRTAALLEDYHRTHGEPRLELVPIETVHYDMADTFAELGFSQNEINGQTYKAIRREVWPKFFAGQSLLLDKPVLGAVEIVKSLAQDALIVYLTGRKTFVAQQSEQALETHGFPTPTNPGTGPGVKMYHKPKSYPGQANPTKLSTHDFKGLITRDELPQYGVVVAAFDNEPKNCLAFRETSPADAIVVHLDTLYAADSPALIDGIDVLPDLVD